MKKEGLSDKASKAMDYINHSANLVTTKSRGEKWEQNVQENKSAYCKGNATLRGLTAFIVCAGPSLEKNVSELKRVGRLGVVTCVDAAFRHLMEKGIVPDYCVSIDSDGRCMAFTEGLDTSKTTLVCMTSASPEVVNAWKGPRYFVNGHGGTEEAGKKLYTLTQKIVANRDIKKGQEMYIGDDAVVEFAGVQASINCGGNVSTAAWSFAYEILRACKIVFVGADFSWGDGNFYAGGHYDHLSHERKTVERILSHPDVNGNVVQTNTSFSSFKMWHETRAIQCMNTHVNASEGGILGIGDAGDCKGKQLDGWEFLTLAEAIDKYTKIEEPCLV